MHIYETKHLDHGITVKIALDDGGAECPLGSYDDHVRLVEFSRRNGVSDTGVTKRGESPFSEPSDVAPWAKANGFICYPVFKYEHGNVAYSLGAFSCPWDSGQCGYLLLSRKEWKRRGKRSDSYAKGALESYTSWCNGEVFGYIIEDSDGNELDSCWGFIGDSKYCLEDALAAAAYHVQEVGESLKAEKLETESAFALAYEESRPDMYSAN